MKKRDNFSIVVANNDPDDQYLIQKAILGNGEHALRPVYTGGQLMDMLQDVKKPLPDFILLDPNMPQMDGFALLALIRSNKRFEQVPVYMLSSYNYRHEIERSQQLGANGFYTKPFQFSKLREIVDEIFDQIGVNSGSRVPGFATNP